MSAEADGVILKAEGISYDIVSDDAGGMYPHLGMASGGVWLSVDEKDIDTARTLLDA